MHYPKSFIIKYEDIVIYVIFLSPGEVLKIFERQKSKEVHLKISLVKIKIDNNLNQDWERTYVGLYYRLMQT